MEVSETRRRVGIGLVGSGFMGRCHANAYASVSGLFDLPVLPEKLVLADATEELAAEQARSLGFAGYASDWNALVANDRVEIVSITAPNKLHEPIALAAINAGKTVYCEKPLSTTARSALTMTEAAEAAGVVTCVGFNFLRNPLIGLAKDLLDSGEIGEVISFRGRHAENYMAHPAVPHSFRTDPEGGGALADIGSHIISLARFLLGPLFQVMGDCQTIHKFRPVHRGSNDCSPVAVDDITCALLRFKNGASGSMEANWCATGRTMDLSFEVTGAKGAICFSQERMNELHLYRRQGPKSGFTRIESGPDHPPYDRFCPAPGHHLGFNDLKVIEVAELLEAHANGTACRPDFREALQVQETVEAIAESARRGSWVDVNHAD